MIAETPADDSPNPPVPELERRLAQQALIAEFGRFALKNNTLQAILDEACRIAADGLEVGFAKVLEPLPKENALLLRARGSAGGPGWSDMPGSERIWKAPQATPSRQASR